MIDRKVKFILGMDDAFYTGILKGELKNGLLVESKGKRIYIVYESITAIEEL